MKKVIVLFLLLVFASPILALEAFESWVTDITVNNGHVTYTVNVYVPTDRGTAWFVKNRRDYICSQKKEAILWGEAKDVSTGEIIDYTSFMDKNKLRKYAPINEYDYENIQQILPYCK